MKMEVITILAFIMLVPVCKVQAIDVDFYSDATIGNGDVYDWVYVYDTPPDYTVVDMYDGSVFVFVTYDSSTVNIYGGDIRLGAPSFDEFATLNIYGYDFNYNGFTLTGFLSDDSPFEFIEIYPSDYAHINLIPEPASILLFGLAGTVLLKSTTWLSEISRVCSASLISLIASEKES